MSIMDSYHKKTADMACPFALSSSSQTTAPDWLWRPLFICEANILLQVQSTKKDKKMICQRAAPYAVDVVLVLRK